MRHKFASLLLLVVAATSTPASADDFSVSLSLGYGSAGFYDYYVSRVYEPVFTPHISHSYVHYETYFPMYRPYHPVHFRSYEARPFYGFIYDPYYCAPHYYYRPALPYVLPYRTVTVVEHVYPSYYSYYTPYSGWSSSLSFGFSYSDRGSRHSFYDRHHHGRNWDRGHGRDWDRHDRGRDWDRRDYGRDWDHRDYGRDDRDRDRREGGRDSWRADSAWERPGFDRSGSGARSEAPSFGTTPGTLRGSPALHGRDSRSPLDSAVSGRQGETPGYAGRTGGGAGERPGRSGETGFAGRDLTGRMLPERGVTPATPATSAGSMRERMDRRAGEVPAPAAGNINQSRFGRTTGESVGGRDLTAESGRTLPYRGATPATPGTSIGSLRERMDRRAGEVPTPAGSLSQSRFGRTGESGRITEPIRTTPRLESTRPELDRSRMDIRRSGPSMPTFDRSPSSSRTDIGRRIESGPMHTMERPAPRMEAPMQRMDSGRSAISQRMDSRGGGSPAAAPGRSSSSSRESFGRSDRR